MAVQAAHLEADAFLVCLNHALSTEKEEVMGLCIGEVRPLGRAGEPKRAAEKGRAPPDVPGRPARLAGTRAGRRQTRP